MRYIYFLSILLLVACSSNSLNTPIPATSTTLPTQTEMPAYRYLALGDSYTIGESVAVKDRWPDQLAKMLDAEGIRTDVTIIAHTGWTVDDLWQGVQADPPVKAYDMVTLLIGVNDQYRGYPVSGYREDFIFMLERCVEYAGGEPHKVIVLSIPDWGFTPFAAARDIEPISRQIDEFNAVNREETKKAGAHYVDVTVISRIALDDIDLIASDNLHPSGKMYTMWAESVLPIALEILE
jgi:lysophospholipase L1-like esterase